MEHIEQAEENRTKNKRKNLNILAAFKCIVNHNPMYSPSVMLFREEGIRKPL